MKGLAGAEGIEPSHGGIKITSSDNKLKADSDSSCSVHVKAHQSVSLPVGISKPRVLHPYDPAEAIGITEAATRAGKSDRTIRNWCLDHQIGRRIAGRWAVSAVALDMLLGGDADSLQAYLAGDRASERITSYFAARSIPLRFISPRTVSGFADFAVADAGNT
jgi:hypothetical protein